MANDNPWHKWYTRFPWTGDNGLRYVTLARDPICVICNRNPSTIADHKIPHKGNWSLFVDLNNTQGVCETCHNQKTRKDEAKKAGEPNAPVTTGETGEQFTSSAVGADALDAALNRED